MQITDPDFFKLLQKTRDKLYAGSGISTVKRRFTIEPSESFLGEEITLAPDVVVHEVTTERSKQGSAQKTPTFQFESEIYDWGEILVWRLRVFLVEDEDTRQKDFYLVGDFDQVSLQEVHIKKSAGNVLHVTCKLEGQRYEYDFGSEIDNLIVPSAIYVDDDSDEKKEAWYLSAGRRYVAVRNLDEDDIFVGTAEISDSWLHVVPELKIAPQDSINLILYIRWNDIKLGRNVATVELKKVVQEVTTERNEQDTEESQKLEVCAWVNVIGTIGEKGEFVFDANEEEVVHEVTTERSEQEFHFSVTKTLTHQFPVSLDKKPWDSFPLFGETQFTMPSENSQRAFLIGDFNEWKSPAYRMEQTGEHFEVGLALSDGEYYYRFLVDGEYRLDAFFPSTVYITKHGAASLKKIQRCTRRITLHNQNAPTFSGCLEPQAAWLNVSQSEQTLDADDKARITLTLVPSHLSPGPNYSSLDIVSKDNPYCRRRISIFVNAVVKGAVIEPRKETYSLPSFQRGQSVDTVLEFDIIGKGDLSGQILPSRLVEEEQGRFSFTNSEQLKCKRYSLAVPLKTDSLRKTSTGSIHGMLVTDCYLANRRVIPIEWKCPDVKQLEFHPSFLHFPTVFYQDSPQLLLCKIRWNNGEPAKGLVFSIPEAADDFLRIEPSNEPGEYEVYLIPKQITKIGPISENISLFDPETELTDSILVSAQIIASTCKVLISQQTNKTFDEKLSLLIKNIGDEPLKLFDIQIEKGRFRCEPKLVEEPVIAPGDSFDFFLVPTVKANSFTEKTVEDQIIVKTSDFKVPNHKIDASIVIPPRLKLFAKQRRRK